MGADVRKLDPLKHEERRRQILAAAGRCFARDGFRGASISDICAEAKISPGHLYHYFENKEAIVSAMTEAAISDADIQLEQLAPTDDPITVVVSRVQSSRAKNRDATHFLVFDMLAEAGHNPAIARILREQNRALRTRFATLLRKGQEIGQVDPGLDPELAASIVISAIDGIKSMNIRDPKLSKDNGATDHLAMLITRFLRPPRT